MCSVNTNDAPAALFPAKGVQTQPFPDSANTAKEPCLMEIKGKLRFHAALLRDEEM
jgi:hypothetical protein